MNERDKELALECQLLSEHTTGIYREALQRFADLIRADEREACANIVRDIGNATETDDYALDKCNEIETVIRSRGNT
jgi:hypothetical protein